MAHQPESESDGKWVVVWKGHGKAILNSYLVSFGTFTGREAALMAAKRRLVSDPDFAEKVRKLTESPMGGRFYALDTGTYLQVDPPADAARGIDD